jgi:hypothetical protein
MQINWLKIFWNALGFIAGQGVALSPLIPAKYQPLAQAFFAFVSAALALHQGTPVMKKPLEVPK